jgi:tetratricopeptide (TPR) repeat protein
MGRKCLTLAAILFIGILCSLPARAADGGRRFAILIGVNRYSNRNLPDLEYAEQDVLELKRLLTPTYNVRLLLGSAKGKDLASKANIERAFNALFRSELSKDDTVLIALTGHGQQVSIDRKGHKGNEPFFCPSGAVPGDVSTLINLSELIERLAERGGGTNLLMVDACRNDPDPTRGRGIDGEMISQLPAGMAVFLSCSQGEKAHESKKAGGGHGLFFHYVLEGISGTGGRNSQGDVSWDHLVAFVKDKVMYDAPKLLGNQAVQQTPRVLANLGPSPILLPHPAPVEFFNRGVAAQNSRDYVKAIEQYNEAIRLDSKYVEAYNRRGWTYNDKGDYDKAIADYNEATRLAPKYIWPYNNRGVSYRAKGQYDKAIADFTEAIRIEPKGSDLLYRNRAWAYELKGDHDKSIADYTTAIQLDPKNAGSYTARGNAYRAKHDYPNAIKDFTEVIRLEPRNAQAVRERGLVHVEKKEYDEAIKDYTEAIRLDPKYTLAYYHRGTAYRYFQKDRDKAIADYTEVIRLNPATLTYEGKNVLADSHRERGYAFSEKQEYDKAIADLNEQVRLAPKSMVAYNDRGNTYLAKKEYDKAIADYSEAIRLGPKWHIGYFNRGLAYGYKKDYDRAIEQYTLALQLNPKYERAYNNRAGAYERKGDKEHAKADRETLEKLKRGAAPASGAGGMAVTTTANAPNTPASNSRTQHWDSKEIFARESAYLGGLGGYTDAGANLKDAAAHRGYARSHGPTEVTDNLVDKYRQQFDLQARKGEAAARTFYAEASARLASYDIDLKGPRANSKDPKVHEEWAKARSLDMVKKEIERKARLVMESR